MGKYGEAALRAVELLASRDVVRPREAWEVATVEIFGEGTSNQLKGCPRDAFLGLCEQGIVKGIPPGNYTRSKKNKQYALKAVQVLRETPGHSAAPGALWNEVMEGEHKTHNQQMEVVTSLWNNNLIVA